jgi:CDP-diacylglycerol pyrophosphatase
MTKAEKEAAAALEAKRAKERERWKKRTQGKKGKEYKEKKNAKKAEWQKRNPKKNNEYVQAFYERHGISGREARALGKDGAKKKPKRPES